MPYDDPYYDSDIAQAIPADEFPPEAPFAKSNVTSTIIVISAAIFGLGVLLGWFIGHPGGDD